MSTIGSQEPFQFTKGLSGRRVLLVTGMSGAGRSTALKILEDIGYESFDNLPASLIPALIENVGLDGPAIAVGADTRTRGFAAETMLDTLRGVVSRSGRELRVLFIDCDDERLERRYTETRRPHPLAGDRPIMDGIRRERQMLSALRDRADLVIDTSALNATGLKRLLTGHFALTPVGCAFLSHRLPTVTACRAKLIWFSTCASLKIRTISMRLRGLTGCDPAVAAHIEADADFPRFFDGLWRLLAAAAAALRNQRQDLSDDCHRMHRRSSPLGLCRRAAGRAVARCRLADRACASRSSASRGRACSPEQMRLSRHRTERQPAQRGNR